MYCLTKSIPTFYPNTDMEIMKRKYLTKLIATIAITITSVNSFASTWNFMFIGNRESLYFFDADTVEKTRDKNVLVWLKTVNTFKPDADGSWSTASRLKINCIKKTIQTVAWSTYGNDGKFMKSSSNPSLETEVTPDSIGEAILKISCESTFPFDKSEKKYFKLNVTDIFEFTRRFAEYEKSQIDSAPK